MIFAHVSNIVAIIYKQPEGEYKAVTLSIDVL